MTFTRKHLVITGIVAGILVGGLAYHFIGRGMGKPQMGGLPVETYTLTPSKLMADLNAVGTMEADESADLRAEVSGRIVAIHFKEGQSVKKGDVLLEIDESAYKTEVDRASAAYDLAKITFQRRESLQKTGAASGQAIDEAESSVQEKRSTLEAAQIRLQKTKITAPFDGIIGLRSLSIGDYLNVGDAITHVVSVDPMKVTFTVPEKFYSQLKDGQKLSVKLDAWPDKFFEGVLYAIDPQIDPDTRNITAKAIVHNPNSEIRPGMFAFVHLEIGVNENALMVPEEALIPNGNQISVMKVVNGKAEMALVTLGVRKQAKAELLTGAKAGDVVVTAGHAKVQPGSPVTAMPAAPAATSAEKQADNKSETK